jgi:hypothetical protein
VLSHRTAGWWWGLVPDSPERIDVSTSSRVRSLPTVRVHHPRDLAQSTTRHRRFPITTVARTLLDLAATSRAADLRQMLAEAEYRDLLDAKAIDAILGQGRRGSKILRQALARHQPRLALTRSRLERAFVELCERAKLPLPEINAPLAGMTVDALWRRERVVVELDGVKAHGSRERIEHDRRRDLRLRQAGVVGIRYTETQVFEEPEAVAADLGATLAMRV